MSGSISNQLSSVAQKIATAETEIEEVKTEIEKVKTDIEEVKTKIATAETEIEKVKPEIEAVKAQLSVVDQQLCASGLPDEQENSLVEDQRYLRKRISELQKRISEDLGVKENHLRDAWKDLRDQLKDLQQGAEGVSGSLFDLNLERTYVCCVTIFANVFLNHVFHRIQRQTHTISAAAAWYHGSPREGQGRATHRFGN